MNIETLLALRTVSNPQTDTHIANAQSLDSIDGQGDSKSFDLVLAEVSPSAASKNTPDTTQAPLTHDEKPLNSDALRQAIAQILIQNNNIDSQPAEGQSSEDTTIIALNQNTFEQLIQASKSETSNITAKDSNHGVLEINLNTAPQKDSGETELNNKIKEIADTINNLLNKSDAQLIVTNLSPQDITTLKELAVKQAQNIKTEEPENNTIAELETTATLSTISLRPPGNDNTNPHIQSAPTQHSNAVQSATTHTNAPETTNAPEITAPHISASAPPPSTTKTNDPTKESHTQTTKTPKTTQTTAQNTVTPNTNTTNGAHIPKNESPLTTPQQTATESHTQNQSERATQTQRPDHTPTTQQERATLSTAEMRALNNANTQTTAPKGTLTAPLLGLEANTDIDILPAQPGQAQITSLQSQTTLITNTPHASQPHPTTQVVAATINQAASKGKDTQISLQLDPPDLGRIDVDLRFSKDKAVKAVLTIEKPETLAMLQRDAHQLERTLQDMGLDGEQSGLSLDLAGEGYDFNHNGQHDGQGPFARTNNAEESDNDQNAINIELDVDMDWHIDPNTGHTHYSIMA